MCVSVGSGYLFAIYLQLVHDAEEYAAFQKHAAKGREIMHIGTNLKSSRMQGSADTCFWRKNL